MFTIFTYLLVSMWEEEWLHQAVGNLQGVGKLQAAGNLQAVGNLQVVHTANIFTIG